MAEAKIHAWNAFEEQQSSAISRPGVKEIGQVKNGETDLLTDVDTSAGGVRLKLELVNWTMYWVAALSWAH